MATRTFKADTMLAAFQDIQRELGPEAIVVSVRKIAGGSPWQVWKQPYVEVVAMTAPSTRNAAEQPSTAETSKPGAKTDGILIRRVDPKAEQQKAAVKRTPAWADVKTQPPDAFQATQAADVAFAGFVEPAVKRSGKTSQKSAHKAGNTTAMDLPGAIGEIRQQLTSQEVDPKIIAKVTRTCLETFGPLGLQDGERVRQHIQRQLEAELRVQTPAATLANRVMCLIGSSGAGKTSTCAKLATFYSKTLGKRVAWICADTVRAGAIGEARMYTDALGINLHLAYTPEDLQDAQAEEADADMILVDMPGCNPRNENKVVELGGFLTAIQKRSTYIVAPATTKETDIMDNLAAFGPFNLKGLIYTKLDETRIFGNLYNVACHSQLPLAFFATGTRVLDDLHPGEDSVLVDALFGEGIAR